MLLLGDSSHVRLLIARWLELTNVSNIANTEAYSGNFVKL